MIYYLTVCLQVHGQHQLKDTKNNFMKPELKNEQKNGLEKSNIPNVATLPKPEQKKAEPAKQTIDDRILKIEQLRSLSVKRKKALDTLNELKAFTFAADDSCTITIEDSQRHSFESGNSNLIGLLKNYLETLLNDKISALDDEILSFQI